MVRFRELIKELKGDIFMRATFARRLAGAVAATAVASAGVLVATATPAAAAPTGCASSTNFAHSAAFSYCSGGSGTHQAVAVCTGNHMVFGSRVGVGERSEARCDQWSQWYNPTTFWVVDHSYWVYD